MQTAELSGMAPSRNKMRGLRSSLQHAYVRTLSATGALKSSRRALAAAGHRVVLTFHRIVPDSEFSTCRSPRGMVMLESNFARVIEYLSSSSTVVAPSMADSPSHGGALPQVIITFDDGWVDNLDVALPYLDSAGMHACFFMTTGLAGRAEPFWPERFLRISNALLQADMLSLLSRGLLELQARASTPCPVLEGSTRFEELLPWLKQFSAETISSWMDSVQSSIDATAPAVITAAGFDPRERLMNWEELQQLSSSGHTIGSHTCSHALLPLLEPSGARQELTESRHQLEKHLHQSADCPTWLSYPNGDASLDVVSLAQQAGYSHAFLNSTGLWRNKTQPLLIPRVNVWDGTVTDAAGAFSPEQLEYSFYWKTSCAKVEG